MVFLYLCAPISAVLRNTLSTLFFFLWNLTVFATYTPFNILQEEDGLTQNTVTCFHQDHNGLLWLGTAEGLNTFDGNRVATFDIRLNNDTFSDSFVTDIAEDASGNIWIATRTHCSVWIRKTNTFQYLSRNIQDDTPSQHTIWFFPLESGRMALLYNNYWLEFQPTEESIGPPLVERFITQPRPVSLLSKDTLLLMQQESVFVTKTSTKDTTLLTRLLPEAKAGIRSASCYRDMLFILTENAIHQIDLKSGSRKAILHSNDSDIPFESANKLIMAEENTIWLGSNHGIYELIQIDNEWERTSHFMTENRIENIFRDDHGMIWVGTAGHGAIMFHSNIFTFKHVTAGDENTTGLLNKVVWSFCENNNDLLVGTNSGLNLLKQYSNGRFQSIASISNAEFAGTHIYTICRDSFYLYIGCGNGFYRMNHGYGDIELFTPIKSNVQVNSVFYSRILSDGRLLASTLNGFMVAEPKSTRFSFISFSDLGITNGYASYIMQARDNTIWACTTNGLLHLTSKLELIRHYNTVDVPTISHQFVSYCREDIHGNIWVATLGGGINRITPKEDHITIYNSSTGLFNEVVHSLLPANGKLWAGTNGGLVCFDTANLSFYHFNRNNGLPFREFNQNAFYIDRSGNLLMGGVDGMIIFQPDNVSLTYTPPVLRLENVLINYEVVKQDSTRIKRKEGESYQITLFHTDKALSMTVSPILFSNRDKYKYYYQLEGFNPQEIPLSENFTINYTNLPYGSFPLVVKAVNIETQQVASELQLMINAIPPFWLRWWFISLEVMGAIGLVVLIMWYTSVLRLKRKLARSELQNSIHQERMRISRDLHDNIGSQLTFIISSLDNVAYKSKEKSQITRIGTFARDTMTQLRETIWAINHDAVSLEEFASNIRQFINRAQSAVPDINIQFSYSGEDHQQFNPVQTINLFRTVQEAVQNAIKYSDASSIKVQIVLAPDRFLSVSISDDGVGFDPAGGSSGYGLRNMKQRLEELKGTLKIASAPNKGTTVSFNVQL